MSDLYQGSGRGWPNFVSSPYQVVLLNALLFSVWHIGYILGGVDGALRATVICTNCKVGVFPNEMGRLTRSLCFQKRVGEQKRSRFQKGTGPFGWETLGRQELTRDVR